MIKDDLHALSYFSGTFRRKYIVEPWPFRRQQVPLVYEGRYLDESFSNEAMMREALKSAPWVTLQTDLFPNEVE